MTGLTKKKFKCPICGKEYSLLGALINHLERNSPGRTFQRGQNGVIEIKYHELAYYFRYLDLVNEFNKLQPTGFKLTGVKDPLKEKIKANQKMLMRHGAGFD